MIILSICSKCTKTQIWVSKRDLEKSPVLNQFLASEFVSWLQELVEKGRI